MKNRLVMTLLLALIITLVTPFSSAFAHHEQGFMFGTTGNGQDVLFDGDHTTGISLAEGESLTITFPTGIDTTGIYVHMSKTGNVLQQLYDPNGELVMGGFLNNITEYDKLTSYTRSNAKSINYEVYTGTATVYEFEIYGTEYTGPDLTAPNEVLNLDATTTDFDVTLIYDFPLNDDFSHVKIYQDNVLLADNVTTTTYSVEGLSFGVTYDFRVTTVDTSGNESLGTSLLATLLEPSVGEIGKLSSEVTYNNVNLFWENPDSTFFDHVNIYRKQIEEEGSFQENLFSASSVSAAEISADYILVYTTSGTSWNDTTVISETNYEYLITTVSTTGNESEGVIVTTEVPSEPVPIIETATIEEDELEDYIVSWTSPMSETIRVLIDGEEYTTVQSSDGSIMIPRGEMEYSFWGQPQIELIPISLSGLEGEEYTPTGVENVSTSSLSFGVNDLLITCMGLLALVAPFLLLSLAIRFQKPIIALLRKVGTYIKERKVKS